MTNVLQFYLDHPRLAAFQITALGLWVLSDLREAPWLPVWRRFVPSTMMVVALGYAVAFGELHRFTADDGLLLVALCVGVWNYWTYLNNRRRGRKPGSDASSVSLTDVVRNAFRREASEAR